MHRVYNKKLSNLSRFQYFQQLLLPELCAMITGIRQTNQQIESLKNSEPSAIPRCESMAQFFSMKNARKKKKVLGGSLRGVKGATEGHIVQISSEALLSQEKWANFQRLTQITAESSEKDHGISFRKKNLKQKINKLEASFFRERRELSQPPVRVEDRARSPSLSGRKLRRPSQISVKQQRTIKLADFSIIKKVGAGTYSQAYLAVDKSTNFVCCLKVINKREIIERGLVQVVMRQIKIHQLLHHEHIVQLYGQFSDESNIYLIQQYCTQGDLYKYLKQQQNSHCDPDIIQVSDIIGQVCQAVLAMHQLCLMHRDIKPENVFLTAGNNVKLGDFGWSVYYGDSNLRTTQCGTPLYLAPELITNQQYSQAVDIWAVGVLSFELLTGQIPFKIRNINDLCKIVTQQIDFQSIDNPLARDFVMRALQKNPLFRMSMSNLVKHPFIAPQLCQ